jgi:hypothetical protein
VNYTDINVRNGSRYEITQYLFPCCLEVAMDVVCVDANDLMIYCTVTRIKVSEFCTPSRAGVVQVT